MAKRVYFRNPKGRPLRAQHAKANAARSAVRSAVEHVFAGQKHRMKLFVRTIGLARARVKIGMANLAFNFNRLAWLEAPSCACLIRMEVRSSRQIDPMSLSRPPLPGRAPDGRQTLLPRRR